MYFIFHFILVISKLHFTWKKCHTFAHWLKANYNSDQFCEPWPIVLCTNLWLLALLCCATEFHPRWISVEVNYEYFRFCFIIMYFNFAVVLSFFFFIYKKKKKKILTNENSSPLTFMFEQILENGTTVNRKYSTKLSNGTWRLFVTHFISNN